MSISFACDCGKSFSVADEYAGKRTKCPACSSALTVPAPESPKGESEEDAAYRALMDSPEPSAPPPGREPADPSPPRRSAPPATDSAPAKPKPKKVKWSADDGAAPARGTSGITISPAVLGGIGAMVLALVWFGLGWSAGRIYIYPPIMFLGGLVTTIRGFLGYEED